MDTFKRKIVESQEEIKLALHTTIEALQDACNHKVGFSIDATINPYLFFATNGFGCVMLAQYVGPFKSNRITIQADESNCIIEHLNFKNVHAFKYSDGGFSILDKSGNALGIDKLTLQEKAFSLALGFIFATAMQNQHPDESARLLQDLFETIWTDDKEIKTMSPEEAILKKEKSGKADFLEAQKLFNDYCDGKPLNVVAEVLDIYFTHIKSILEIIAFDKSKVGKPHGWTNLFMMRQPNFIAVIGDFNSHFNSIKVGQDDPVVGLFAMDSMMPLHESIEYNHAKPHLIIEMMKIALNLIEDGEKSSVKWDKNKFKAYADKVIAQNKPDTRSIPAIHKLEITPVVNKFKPTPTPREQKENLDEKAFDLMLESSEFDQILKGAGLIQALIEVIKDETKEKTMLYMNSTVFSHDKELKTMRLVFNNHDDIVFTLDINKNSFYIEEKSTLEKWTFENFEGNDLRRAKIIEQFLRTINNEISLEKLIQFIAKHRKTN